MPYRRYHRWDVRRYVVQVQSGLRTPPALTWPDWLAVAFAVAVIWIGADSLIGAPSSSLVQVIGWSTIAWAIGMVGAGCSSTWAMLTRNRRVELVGMCAIGALTLVHGLAILIATDAAGDSTGQRLIAAALCTVALAGTRWQRGLTRQEITDALHREATR